MGGQGWGYRILLVGIGLCVGAIVGTCLAVPGAGVLVSPRGIILSFEFGALYLLVLAACVPPISRCATAMVQSRAAWFLLYTVLCLAAIFSVLVVFLQTCVVLTLS